MEGKNNQYDVAILGAGIAGSLLATILARQGVRVLLIDAGTHPRFALGESTVRHTFRLIKIMAERFDVPELRKANSGDNVRKYVTPACGEKRNFGFVYHREGQDQKQEEATQLVIPPFREGYEAHLFRQDIDSYLYYAALHCGAEGRTATRIDNIDIGQDRVRLQAGDGEVFTASFVVDGSGFRSPLAQKLNLREEPTRCKTHSRALFTHMIDLKPYDECVHNMHGTPEKWYNGTCHHLFDGGWLWVIPFDNHPESPNPLVSVGLNLDSRRFPKPNDISPQQEWENFLERFPSIAGQFKDAKVVRPWVSTGRLQYSSKQVVGDRWCLMAHAAGNIDALFSRGLANTMEGINALVPPLLAAIREDDFKVERFGYMEQLLQNIITNNDYLVYGGYVSFRDFDLWNAWFRVWALGVGLGDLRLAGTYRMFLKTRDESILPDAEAPMGLFCSNHKEFGELFCSAVGEIEAVDQGLLDPKEAARRIIALIQAANYTAPAIRLGDPSNRYINAGTPGVMLRAALWTVTSAPPEVRKYLLGAAGGFFSRGKAPLESPVAANRPATAD